MHVYHYLIHYSKMEMTLHNVHCSIIYECIEFVVYSPFELESQNL